MNQIEICNQVLSTIGKVKMSITVTKSVYSMMKRELEVKRKRVANENAELKALEATFKSVKVVSKRKR